MAAKKAVKRASKSKDFDIDALLNYMRKVTGQDEASGYANVGSKVNAKLSKDVPKYVGRGVREADSWITGGAGGLAFDAGLGEAVGAQPKPMGAKNLAVGAGMVGLNFLPLGKLGKVGSKGRKVAKGANAGRKLAIKTYRELQLLGKILEGKVGNTDVYPIMVQPLLAIV